MYFRTPNFTLLRWALLASIASFAVTAQADILCVDIDGGGSGIWADAYADLQDALDDAVDGDEIWVAEGTYVPGTSAGDSYTLVEGVAVYGGFEGTETQLDQRDPDEHETILSGDSGSRYHVVCSTDIDDPNTILDGFTISGGYANGGGDYGDYGGGMLIRNTASASGLIYGPTIVDCLFEYNQAAENGGALYIYDASVHVLDCAFENNTAERGGAVFLADYDSTQRSALAFIDCVFQSNTALSSAGAGGAVYNGDGASWWHCRFGGNVAYEDGGAIYGYEASTHLHGCIFHGNDATTATWGQGGAICHFGGRLTIRNSVVAFNEAKMCGGVYDVAGCSLDAWNSIFYHNTDTYYTGTSQEQIKGSATEYCCIENYSGSATGTISDDPNFVDPNGADGTHGTPDDDYHLGSESPCIDAGSTCDVYYDMFDLDGDGDPNEFMPIDFDGEGRFADDESTPDTGVGGPLVVDMGAYEFGTSYDWCPGDLDGDRDVDLSDLAELLSNYGTTSGADLADGDSDCNGTVVLGDLAALLAHYGDTCDGYTGSGSSEIPGPAAVTVSVAAYDTGGYSGGGFEGEVEHFVFDLKIQIHDPNDDDWTASGAVLDAKNSATFRLSSSPTTGDAYATFVAPPWVTVPSGSTGATVAGAYDPPDSTYEFQTDEVNIAWFDLVESHDGPATVMRLVIDVSSVNGADVSSGFGSVYFSQTGPNGNSDILVAELQSGTATEWYGGGLESYDGSFYVKGE